VRRFYGRHASLIFDVGMACPRRRRCHRPHLVGLERRRHLLRIFWVLVVSYPVFLIPAGTLFFVLHVFGMPARFPPLTDFLLTQFVACRYSRIVCQVPQMRLRFEIVDTQRVGWLLCAHLQLFAIVVSIVEVSCGLVPCFEFVRLSRIVVVLVVFRVRLPVFVPVDKSMTVG